MIKSDFTLRRFLDTFVPGFILLIGIWYLFRPYLLKYFPNIAFDPTNQQLSSELKVIVFLTVATSLGIVVNHMADIAVSLNYFNSEISDKSLRPFKRFARGVFSIFTFHHIKDPRILIINRYLNSPRKNEFIKLITEWAFSDEEKLKIEKEAIITHQHICTRIRVISEQGESLYDNAFSEVAFAGALFTTFFLLIPITLLAMLANSYIPIENKGFDFGLLVILLFLFYLISILFNYSLRRRFRHFSSQIITIGLHLFEEKKLKILSDKMDHTK